MDPRAGHWYGLVHGITSWRDFVTKLHEVAGQYDVIVYETFRLYRTHAKTLIGNDMQTSQCIGAIKLSAWTRKVRLVSHGAHVKRVAERSAPQWLKDHLARFPKVHDEAHDADALLHLWHWTFTKTDVDPKSHEVTRNE